MYIIEGRPGPNGAEGITPVRNSASCSPAPSNDRALPVQETVERCLAKLSGAGTATR